MLLYTPTKSKMNHNNLNLSLDIQSYEFFISLFPPPLPLLTAYSTAPS